MESNQDIKLPQAEIEVVTVRASRDRLTPIRMYKAEKRMTLQEILLSGAEMLIAASKQEEK